jgi:hypothetical protein
MQQVCKLAATPSLQHTLLPAPLTVLSLLKTFPKHRVTGIPDHKRFPSFFSVFIPTHRREQIQKDDGRLLIRSQELISGLATGAKYELCVSAKGGCL